MFDWFESKSNFFSDFEYGIPIPISNFGRGHTNWFWRKLHIVPVFHARYTKNA
jgi:hypothetical protein